MDAPAPVTAIAAPTTACHRSDPLDIPLIDGHFVTHMLMPRLINAVKLAFPQLYLDWMTGTTVPGPQASLVVAAENGHPGAQRDSHGDSFATSASPFQGKYTLAWKRAGEALLHSCLLLASCRSVLRLPLSEKDISIATPAMKNLGMVLRPVAVASQLQPVVARDRDRNILRALRSRLQTYGKIGALILATVILPSLYQELKNRREKELEWRDRRRRLEEIRRDLSDTSPFINTQQCQQQRQSQLRSSRDASASAVTTLRRRSEQRRSLLQAFLADAILGMGDIILPPLRLIQYLSYLWGIGVGGFLSTNTPSLGMALAGWEYVPAVDTGGGGSSHERYQRHTNFHYGHRRLLVEEALRTMRAVLPPRRDDRNTGSDSVLVRRRNGQDGDDERFLTVNGDNSTGTVREDGGEQGSHSNTLSR